MSWAPLKTEPTFSDDYSDYIWSNLRRASHLSVLSRYVQVAGVGLLQVAVDDWKDKMTQVFPFKLVFLMLLINQCNSKAKTYRVLFKR